MTKGYDVGREAPRPLDSSPNTYSFDPISLLNESRPFSFGNKAQSVEPDVLDFSRNDPLMAAEGRNVTTFQFGNKPGRGQIIEAVVEEGGNQVRKATEGNGHEDRYLRELNRTQESAANSEEVRTAKEIKNWIKNDANFRRLDANGDGFISKSELDNIANSEKYMLNFTRAERWYIDYLRKHYQGMQGASDDEWGIENDGITRNDINNYPSYFVERRKADVTSEYCKERLISRLKKKLIGIDDKGTLDDL